MSTPRLLSVLLVDDSALVRVRLCRLLEESDARCVFMEAATVAEATRALRNFRPDVVVLDLSLPDGNGFDLLPFLKRMTPKCAVILLTNHDAQAIRERATSLGIDYVFQKAIQFELVPVVMQRMAAQLRAGTVPRSKPQSE